MTKPPKLTNKQVIDDAYFALVFVMIKKEFDKNGYPLNKGVCKECGLTMQKGNHIVGG